MGEGEDNVKDAPVTHLALQKLLYFVQSWSRTLLDQAMFDDDCEEESLEFGEQEQRILNAVKKYYFDIYSAKALEEICHREPPYIETREGFPEGKACHKVMDAEKISSYYGKVVQKYKIRLSDMSNIKVYLSIILSY